MVSANSNSAASKFKYNGKELDESLGLNMYDYGARFYDPATGRWFTPDALAEKYYDQSTYTYALNNPVIYIDPDGNQVEMCCKGLKDFLKGAARETWNITKGTFAPYQAYQAVKQEVSFLQNSTSSSSGGGSAITLSELGTETLDRTGIPALADKAEAAIGGDMEAAGELTIGVGTYLLARKAIKSSTSSAAPTAEVAAATAEASPVTNTIYKRPNNATTPKQRASVQKKPCVDCGATGQKNFADHKTTLVEEHYTTGAIDKVKMRSLDAVQPQCQGCQSAQATAARAYSMRMREIIINRTSSE